MQRACFAHLREQFAAKMALGGDQIILHGGQALIGVQTLVDKGVQQRISVLYSGGEKILIHGR